MRRLFLFAAVAVIAVAAAWSASRAEEPTTVRADPKLPDIPGAFHAFNVTGKFKGHFHSRISEHGLEPMVMIFTREVDFSDPLKSLLGQIDAVTEKNPAARLNPFVVVQSDDLAEVVGAADKTDDERLQLNKKLGDEADGLKFQHVEIDLAGAADLIKFKVDDAPFAFFLFQRGKITGSRVFTKEDKLTDAEVKAILALHVAPFGPQNTALVVTRDANLSDPLKALLRRMDDAVEKNPAARLHPVLALLIDGPNRDDKAADLEKALMLKHVEVVAAVASDVAKYHVEDAPFAFFLSQHGKVTAAQVLKKDQTLTDAQADAIMTILAEKAGADKK